MWYVGMGSHECEGGLRTVAVMAYPLRASLRTGDPQSIVRDSYLSGLILSDRGGRAQRLNRLLEPLLSTRVVAIAPWLNMGTEA